MQYTSVRASSLWMLLAAFGLSNCGGDSAGPGGLPVPTDGPGGDGATGGSAGDGQDNGGAIGTDGDFVTDIDGPLDGSGDDELDPDNACAAESRQGDPAVVAMYFMVDISGSMLCPVPDTDPSCEVDPGAPYSSVTRWTETSAALKDFFAAPGGDGMMGGIGFFPRSSGGNVACGASDYATPDAEIAALPDASTAIDAVIDAQDPSGQTPTVPALQGAVSHAEEWAAMHPEQQVVVVYATDGYPRGCGNSNDIAGAAAAAAAGYQGDAIIRTYVLGVGSNLTDLNQVALAGGTEQALFIDAGQDVTAQLTAALNSIRDSVVVPCTYTIPEPPPGQELDPSLVNIRYTSGGGAVSDVARDPSETECNTGWQYSEDGSQIMLCGDTCAAVSADPQARIDVLFGCQTIIDIQ